MGRERRFRTNKVIPFLKTLRNTFSEPIQQMSICASPDFMLCSRGLMVGLELKDDGEEPTKLQHYKGSEIMRCGGIYLVARPSNWESIKLALIKLDRGGTNEIRKTKSKAY